MTSAQEDACPLCGGRASFVLAVVAQKPYLRCPLCRLTYLSRAHHLPPDEERDRYAQHNNDPANPGYRAFLARLVDPLIPKLPPGAVGLDYGSGPGPTIDVMLAELGYTVRNYDPYFAPETAALQQSYDFITCSETAEHFYSPAAEFARLQSLLRPGAWLGIMTGTPPDDDRFPGWWYLKDPTHVCFYAAETMQWIAGQFGWHVEFPRENVTLFQKE
jgi:hypothetical protein